MAERESEREREREPVTEFVTEYAFSFDSLLIVIVTLIVIGCDSLFLVNFQAFER